MATLEEMTAWSTDEIRGEVRKLLPSSWKLSLRPDTSGYWRIWIEEDQKIIWEATETDERRALFEAYGYLWMKQRPLREVDSPWVRRSPMFDPPRRSVSDSSPDPEDLDPDEVESVYRSLGKTSSHGFFEK